MTDITKAYCTYPDCKCGELEVEVERLTAENADLRRWKALNKPLTAAMGIAQAEIMRSANISIAEIERLKAKIEELRRGMALDQAEIDQQHAALHEIVVLDHYPDATIARKALGLPTTDRDAPEPWWDAKT